MASTLNENSLNVGGPVTCTTVDTGKGATEVHLMNQNLKTTDNVQFASVNTGYGANPVYKISDQTIAFGDLSNTDKILSIPAMDIKEIRTVNTSGSVSSNGSDPHNLALDLPAGGTYFVLGQAIPQRDNDAFGGVYPGGTTVARVKHNSKEAKPFKVALMVRRIS